MHSSGPLPIQLLGLVLFIWSISQMGIAYNTKVESLLFYRVCTVEEGSQVKPGTTPHRSSYGCLWWIGLSVHPDQTSGFEHLALLQKKIFLIWCTFSCILVFLKSFNAKNSTRIFLKKTLSSFCMLGSGE